MNKPIRCLRKYKYAQCFKQVIHYSNIILATAILMRTIKLYTHVDWLTYMGICEENEDAGCFSFQRSILDSYSEK